MWFTNLVPFTNRRSQSLPLRQPMARRRSTARLSLETLEDRCVPTVGFGSALGVGNDTGHSKANSVAVDAVGNSYLTGSFSGTTDFDPAHTRADNSDLLTSPGGSDIFVAKYAPDDTLIWARRMGGADTPVINNAVTDVGYKTAIDTSGNVYVTGQFFGTADFGSVTLTSAGDSDAFVAKLDSSGIVQWANRWGTTAADIGRGIGVDAARNVYVFGNEHTGPTGLPGDDILKFSPTGAAQWAKWIDTPNASPVGDMAVDATGKVFVCGWFAGTVDFDPGLKTHYVSTGTTFAAFVLNLDTKGNFGWVSPFARVVGATSGSASAQSLALDGGGNVIVGGWYLGSIDFNPGTGTTTLPTVGGAFITKLNGAGSLVWARALESAATTFVYGLAVDAAGSIYATGTLNGTVDFDPGAGTQTRTTAGGFDAFVMKLNAAGNFVWAESFGSTGNEVGWDVAVDAAGTVYLAGGYQGTVDFDPDPLAVSALSNSGDFTNIYFVKLHQS